MNEQDKDLDEIQATRKKLQDMLRFPPCEVVSNIIESMEVYKMHDVIADIHRHYTAAGLGKRHLKRVENTSAEWQRCLNAAVERMGSGCVLGLVGNRGTGKTQLAAYLIRRSAERQEVMYKSVYNPIGAKYRTWGDIVREVKATFTSDSKQTEQDVIRDLVYSPLLVIDEIHEGRGSDFEAALFTCIVDERYREVRDTVLISNQQKAAFTQFVGPSVADRMSEGGGIIEMKWDSFRKPQQPAEA